MSESPTKPGVLFVLNTLARGGMERITVTLSQQLKQAGRYEPVIACLAAEPGELAAAAQSAGVRVLHGLLRHKFDVHAISRLRRVFGGDGGPAIAAAVIVDAGGDRMFWTSLARGRRRGPGRPALIVASHAMPAPMHRRIEWINRRFIGRLDAVIALGPRHAAALASQEGLPADRMHVVPNGLEAERVVRLADGSGRDAMRADLGVGSGDVLVMCVSNPRRAKRVDLFCQTAADLLAAPGGQRLRFRLVGDGEGRDELSRTIHRLNLREPGFAWLGRRADVERLWPAADIGVCCSGPDACEVLSVAMLEAMAAGVAFVSTAVGDHPTAIDDCHTGLLVEPDAPQAMAAAIARLAGDADLRRRMGSAARQRVTTCYTADAMAAAFQAVLDAVVGSPGGTLQPRE